MYAHNMWEPAIEHREPILELCDDLERWNAAGRGERAEIEEPGLSLLQSWKASASAGRAVDPNA